jgi:hypothetical protein
MAKKTAHRSHALARRISTPKPIVIRTTKIVKSKHKRHGGRRSGGLSVGGLFSKDRITTIGAGFAVGVIEKMAFVQNLPSLPFIGKTGTLGVAAYLLSDGGRNRMANDVATAALTIAGFMMGSTGSIVGEGEVPDVSGYVAGF